MKKFMTKAMFRGLELQKKAGERLRENDGNVITENGMVIAVCFVIALLILGWATGFLKNTFLPTVGNFFTKLFNFSF